MNILIKEVESLGNFLQNDTKFVEISLVVAEILQYQFWLVPSFFTKISSFERAYLQNYSSNFNKIENLGVLHEL